MTDPVAVRGVVATTPRHVIPEVGAPITTFRLVTGESPLVAACGDASDDGRHNWYTVTAAGPLASSAAACVDRGDPLVVSGRLRVREWQGEPEGVTAEIEAFAIGHDLTWGRCVFTRYVVDAQLVARGEVRGGPTGAAP
jgi:single-strand DNA-binding protein